MTVSLTNTLGRMQIFVLPHETYCQALGKCACEVEHGRVARRIPSSLTLPAGATVAGLPEAILSVRDVVAAHRRGALGVARRAPRTAERLPPAPPVAQPKTRSTRRKRGG
jgi:hypothetical protein